MRWSFLLGLPLLLAACEEQARSCPQTCTEGAIRCAATQQEVCVAGPGGCPVWSAPRDCPPHQICEGGGCVPCPEQCSATDVRCSDDGRGVHQCALLPTGCGGWGARVACGSAESCTAGLCAFDAVVPHTELIEAIPDYLQTDPAYGGFANGGINHCAPVAVSNTLIWLDDNGLDLLAENSADRKQDQHAMITELASEQYMNTNPDNGTSPSSLILGVHKFLEARQYLYDRLQWQGYRSVGETFATEKTAPEIDWIKKGFYEGGAVWLNVGFYVHDAASDTYARDFGHWVTLVGFGSDGAKEDAAYLVIHDPAPRAGLDFESHYVSVERLESGTLTGSYSGLPRSAAGFYKLGPGMHLPTSANTAIIDGVVVLVP